MPTVNVLFVDDEANILHAIKRAVLQEDFQAHFAQSGEEALLMLAGHEFAVLVTDMRMPGMGGLGLLQEAKRLYPHTLRVVLSGYTELSNMLASINQGDIFRFITKPWDMENDLLPVLRQGIEFYQLRREKEKQVAALEQRNVIYKKMLHHLNTRIADRPDDLEHYKRVTAQLLKQLMQDSQKPVAAAHQQEKLALVQLIMDEYGATLPSEKTQFSQADIAAKLPTYFSVHAERQQYRLSQKGTPEVYYGNWRLLQMLLATCARLVGKTAANRTLKGLLSSDVYAEKGVARISHVLEFGYVDGAQVLIDQQEWITYEVLEFYTAILNRMAGFQQMSVTYTYVNQNASMLTVVAQLPLAATITEPEV